MIDATRTFAGDRRLTCTGSRRRPALTAVPALALTLLAAGCGSTDSAAAERAAHFYDALAAGDGTTACADLAPEARSSLEQQDGVPCAQAILDQELAAPSGRAVTRTYGAMAQVDHPGETMFLSRFKEGWRVTAVGCAPAHGDRPHECLVEVG
ncbi:hypothetical protein KVF89_22265 [Nocardioides carbamazepini]|uniref:hypothetical protein n=1 Tax=Nocardioides carbamazepini TaxID=2854259 RepID=UPI00214A242C|nr:hypothetical protein [Nocardioides carbamazepini]MCR1785281.1 hypothetical protein [Nocardioides carbamazepini]